MDKPTSDMQQEILALQCPKLTPTREVGSSDYVAGFRAGYEEARREIAALVGERLVGQETKKANEPRTLTCNCGATWDV